MDIFLTNLSTNDRLRFPMLPTEISIQRANQFASYTILSIGEIRIPSGTSLDAFSWNGILPGKNRRSAPYIFDWQSPKAIYQWIEKLKAQNAKPVRARLLITETPINCDVYLSSFTGAPTGGYGDINYSISLIQAKELKVSRSAKILEPLNNKPAADTPPAAAASEAAAPARPSPPAPRTYTVVKGDCLWKIAQRFLGSGSAYPRIYQANRSVIDAHRGGPNMIWPGDVLTIPS